MSVDPYKSNIAAKIKFAQKRVVRAKIVVILEGTVENRGITMIPQGSRCVRKGEIFEFMTTPEKVKPGDTVNNVSYHGFAEVSVGGVLRVGDTLCAGFQKLAKIVGFDETHFPNHQNVVLTPIPADKPFGYNFFIEEEISFVME